MPETDLVTRTQLVVLARTLQVTPQHLAPLARLGADQLHQLQDRMMRILFDQHAETFRRASLLVPIVPLSIGIPLVQRLVPPMVAGRLAGAVGVDHLKKAAEAVSMLDPRYAADCAPYLDPRVFAELVEVAPPEPAMRILNEILRRGDYVTAAGFLAAATPPMIAAVEELVHDDAGLIFTAAFAYSADTLSAIVRQLLAGPRQRVPRMMQTVLAGPPALQHAMLAVFCRWEPDVVENVGDIFFGHGHVPDVGRFVISALSGRATPELLTVVGRLTPFAHWALAGNPVFADPQVLAALVRALERRHDPDSWRGLFALSTRLNEPSRRYIAGLLAAMSAETVALLPGCATDAHCWPALLQLIAESSADQQDRIGAIWATLPPERRGGLHRHIHEHRYDTRLARITEVLAPVSLEEVFYHRRRRVRYRGG
ncbi:hypothetical protein [Nocardia cyriacigeorgica]|uniref:hypothetical protein n=1 Tax=Nocardia cyriacigeorgica TaxID=135487 RepID=UPI002456A05A|nr:hypothetical protein [Nocardia cyriacigeorgica]